MKYKTIQSPGNWVDAPREITITTGAECATVTDPAGPSVSVRFKAPAPGRRHPKKNHARWFVTVNGEPSEMLAAMIGTDVHSGLVVAFAQDMGIDREAMHREIPAAVALAAWQVACNTY